MSDNVRFVHGEPLLRQHLFYYSRKAQVLQFLNGIRHTDNEATQNALAELTFDLELIEMEMQASQILLR
jgi:hypothetical protein